MEGEVLVEQLMHHLDELEENLGNQQNQFRYM